MTEELHKCPAGKYGGYNREDTKHITIPEESILLMNDTIVNNINKTVKAKDYLIHLGDFGFFDSIEELVAFRNRINCRNIYLCLGNHDDEELYISSGLFTMIPQLSLLNIHGQFIVVSHYAPLSWDKSHRGSWACWGHSHGGLNSLIEEKLPSWKFLDVGVDTNCYNPYSFEQIKKIMESKCS